MDEKALLEAICGIVREEVAGAEQRIMDQTKELISASEQSTAQNTVALMDAQFMGQFNLLAEGQEDILRRMPNEDNMDIIDGRLTDLEADVRKLKVQVNRLKQAQ